MSTFVLRRMPLANNKNTISLEQRTRILYEHTGFCNSTCNHKIKSIALYLG